MNERPAWYQINNIFECTKCHHKQEVQKGYSAQMPCPMCRGYVQRVGESYPGDKHDLDEVEIKGNWYNKNDINYNG